MCSRLFRGVCVAVASVWRWGMAGMCAVHGMVWCVAWGLQGMRMRAADHVMLYCNSQYAHMLPELMCGIPAESALPGGINRARARRTFHNACYANAMFVICSRPNPLLTLVNFPLTPTPYVQIFSSIMHSPHLHSTKNLRQPTPCFAINPIHPPFPCDPDLRPRHTPSIYATSPRRHDAIRERLIINWSA